MSMNKHLKDNLLKIAEIRQVKDDPSHDFQHILRVLNLVIKIGKSINADLDIVIPAALFHDTVVYKKNSPESKNEANESAEIAEQILSGFKEYPKNKIEYVKICIKECSFSKGIKPNSIESKVLQDADRLEATGSISIMRTFASTGHMNMPLYAKEDPLCKKGAVKFRSGVDLFYNRLLIVEKTMHTKFAKKIAKKRTIFLKKFLKQFEEELIESGVIK